MIQKSVPVLLLTGFLGAGKTTLINHILKNQTGHKVAIIVNDIGKVNIDERLIDKEATMQQEDNDVVGLSNGCICCTLKVDLLNQLSGLVQTNKFDYIMIEASGICEPIPIAQTITMANETLRSRGLAEQFHLDSIICVADAMRLANEFQCGQHFLEEDEKQESLDTLLMQQLEFCNKIILNKVEMVTMAEKETIQAVLRKLSHNAKIIEASFANVDLTELLDTNDFDYLEACNGIGWLSDLEHHHEHHHHHEHNHEHEHDHLAEYGITTFVYEERRPMDLKKFSALLNNYPKVIRTKGYVWFDSEPDIAYLFEQAGKQTSLNQDSLWIASAPKSQQAELLESNPHIKKLWQEPYGDRINELVFIGQNMNEEEIRQALDACLA